MYKLDDCMKLIIRWEGFRKNPYLCPAGIPTIGYGSTMYPNGKKVSLRDRAITEAEAKVMLEAECYAIGRKVIRAVTVDLTDGQTNALISFVYNVGYGSFLNSTMLKKLLRKDYVGASKEFARWNKAKVNGKLTVLKGLTERRRAEENEFNR